MNGKVFELMFPNKFSFFILVVIGIELRDSCVPDKCLIAQS